MMLRMNDIVYAMKSYLMLFNIFFNISIYLNIITKVKRIVNKLKSLIY